MVEASIIGERREQWSEANNSSSICSIQLSRLTNGPSNHLSVHYGFSQNARRPPSPSIPTPFIARFLETLGMENTFVKAAREHEFFYL
jgi:hypothetical protein